MSYAEDTLVYGQGGVCEQIARELQTELQTELNHTERGCGEAVVLVDPNKVSVTWLDLNNHIVEPPTPAVSPSGENTYNEISKVVVDSNLTSLNMQTWW